MNNNSKKPVPLSFKPNMDEVAMRWNAFYEGEIIDRPIVCVTAPREGFKDVKHVDVCDYYDKVCGDMDATIERVIRSAEATFYGGEAVPGYTPSMGPDEIAVFCGGKLGWSESTEGRIYTNWSKPIVDNWEDSLPIKLDDANPLWQRLLEFYRRAVDKMAGKMLLVPPDLHTNMDLLSALRGPERLCMDLLDQPEQIDKAMLDARAVFPKVWDAVREAGRMDELGYCNGVYSMEGAAILQCDFSCMISPEMFRRWVLPALEEEAEIVKHVIYHWDGPGALVHTNDLVSSKGLHTLSYVPGEGHGDHTDYIDMYKKLQKGGKAVQVGGSIDQVKHMHRELRPEKTLYSTYASSQSEAEELLEWFVKNT